MVYERPPNFMVNIDYSFLELVATIIEPES